MKKYFLILSGFLATLFYSQEKVTLVSDGPYVFYKNDSIVVSALNKGEINKKWYSKNAKSDILLNINFPENSDKNFSLKLKPSLKTEPSVWNQPKKMIVLSDIEGEFDALRNLLLANKVIDKKYRWKFGKGHLIICGDLFDRGSQVPATLWLLYKLEQEAEKKGGYVHTILGNHDIMNLAGNFKYVDKKYFSASEKMGLQYTDIYSPETELGRWLRSKNLIEKVGNGIFLHGGVSPDINGLKLSIKEINDKSRPYIGWKDLKKTVKNDTILKIFNSTDGLFWFRGYFKKPTVDEAVVDQTLSLYNVEKIVVGHTILHTNVGFYYNRKVLGIDVNQHEGDHQGALYLRKKWYKINLSGKKLPIPEN